MPVRNLVAWGIPSSASALKLISSLLVFSLGTAGLKGTLLLGGRSTQGGCLWYFFLLDLTQWYFPVAKNVDSPDLLFFLVVPALLNME